MNLFKFIKKHRLCKEDSNKIERVVSNFESLNQVMSPLDEVFFESDTLVSLTENNFLDTTSPLNISMYKNNLKLLIEQTKQRGYVDRFMLIRDDDYFPYDWEWRVSSKNTCIEKNNSYLSYVLRKNIARKSLGISTSNDFCIPFDDSKLNVEISKIDKMLGSVLMPVKFRSTKHFTINTPLSYTGEYNGVRAGRNFTIIDDISSFLKSGYAYSADYRDAYLDATHESLKISDMAIVLISEDKYQDIIEDRIVAEQLKNRRVIIYKGEEAVAINMVLSELGVLPSRPGNMFCTYDDEIRLILENSMKSLCASHNIEYSKGHGNLFGKGGHFSDLYDGYNHDFEMAQEDFLSYLLKKFPQASHFINYHLYRDEYCADKFVNLVGVDALLIAIEEYNQMVKDKFTITFQQYKDDRKRITPEISVIFKETVKLINLYYMREQESMLNVDDMYQLRELIRLFYHSDSVDSQLLAANQICSILVKDMDFENNDNNTFTI